MPDEEKKSDSYTEYIYRLRRKEFSESAQKTLSQLDIALQDIQKISIPAELPDIELKVTKLKRRIEGIIRTIKDLTVTFFDGKDEVTILHLDKEIQKFETERALLNNQIKQLKVQTFPEPKLPKYLLPIAIGLLSFTSTMVGVFHSIYKIDWRITAVSAISLYVITFIFLAYALIKLNKYDRDKKIKYDALFEEPI